MYIKAVIEILKRSLFQAKLLTNKMMKKNIESDIFIFDKIA